MENRIDIAKLLKYCPKGMELDCSIFEEVTLYKIDTDIENEFPIRVKTKNDYFLDLTKYGTYSNVEEAKCVIFPKGKTTWEGFHRPFKDGDILATDLGSVFYLNTHLNTYEYYGCYVGIGGDGSFHICKPFAYQECCGFATEEEKQKLFDAIKANGYKWNPETKTLKKLVEPKFKVGDEVQGFGGILVTAPDNWEIVPDKSDISKPKPYFKVGDRIKDKNNKIWFVVQVSDKHFSISLIPNAEGYFVPIEDQDDYELVPNKFDISKLKPFDKVLVRDFDNETWEINFFSRLLDGKHFKCLDLTYVQCIPYEGNEHLYNTTNKCDEFFKVWKS